MSPPIAPPEHRRRADGKSSPPRALILLGMTFLIVAAIVFGAARGHRDLQAARLRASTLERQIALARERVAELERRIERTRDDPVTWERLAREELGLVRPDDIVVVLPEAGEN
jgi:cell division protein FtsB